MTQVVSQFALRFAPALTNAKKGLDRVSARHHATIRALGFSASFCKDGTVHLYIRRGQSPIRCLDWPDAALRASTIFAESVI